jgi:hypothetical protein
MKAAWHTLIAVVFGLYLPTHSAAQGCSDAGVCTAGPIGEFQFYPDSVEGKSEFRHMARMTYSYAVAEREVLVQQVVPELALGITEKLSVQIKVPYLIALGTLSNENGTKANAGLSDIVATVSYAFIKERDRQFIGVLGMRLPTGTTDAANTDVSTDMQERPLPMPYQTGLGTTDLLLGSIYRYKRWSATLAYQHVLTQANNNGFRRDLWPANSDAQGYFESDGLERGNDLVMRLQYAFKFGRFGLQPGLLGIQRLSEDTRINMEGVRVNAEGSSGLTLNATVDARFAISEHWMLELTYGSPLIVRPERPDGLTRFRVVNVALAYRFGR